MSCRVGMRHKRQHSEEKKKNVLQGNSAKMLTNLRFTGHMDEYPQVEQRRTNTVDTRSLSRTGEVVVPCWKEM